MTRFIQKWQNHSKDPWVRKTYKAWNSMWDRCTNPKATGYSNYGGRGITVCNQWKNFDIFVKDMDLAPEKHSLEREDVNGDYGPFNCVWATRKQQANNTRTNVKVSHLGKTMTVTEWADHYDMPPSRLHSRLRAEWPFERAIESKIPADHGTPTKYTNGKCRCQICKDAMSKERNRQYRLKNPEIRNKSKHSPKLEYDL